jgi:hypothetical protein
MDRDQLIHLLAIWKVCHLNGMNAGSLLQSEYTEFYRDQIKPANQGWDYDEVCAMLKQHHLLIDNETNPELTVGYRYGTLWLINYLPNDVIQFINDLQLTPPDETRSAIMDYLLSNDYHWEIKITNCNPNMQSDTQMDHWKIVLIKGDNDDCLETYFSTGIGHRLQSNDKFADQFKIGRLLTNWKNQTIRMMGFRPAQTKRDQMIEGHKTIQELGFFPPPIGHISDRSFEGVRVPPMPDQVVECICGDWLSIENYGSWDDWACDMGFDIDSKMDRLKAKTSYNTIQMQSDKAQMFFGSDWSELIERTY